MQTSAIVPIADRVYATIPMAKIRVLNSRNRNQAQFDENVRSIDAVGLLKPIMVNGRNYEVNGFYDLVCGEGRYLACKRLGKTEIAAEVIDCDEKTALLISLIENIARVPPHTMWFAHEMKRMHDAGLSFSKISQIVGKHQSWVSDYIQLVEQGEQRLINGLEQGLFPITFAMQVARTPNSDIQHVLMDAFDSEVINSANTARVKRLIELRLARGRNATKSTSRSDAGKSIYTVKDLKKDITQVTNKKEQFVRQATEKEHRLFMLIAGMKALWQDEKFVALLNEEGITGRPELRGDYGPDI